MPAHSLSRRTLLTYLGFASLGLGAAAATHQFRGHQFRGRAMPSALTTATPIARKPIPPAKEMPEFQGISAWLNSKSLSRSDLKGKVVLIHIWTFSCINCQRTLPSVVQWHRDYASKGLQVIGVHTPEFPFERDLGNIKDALKKHGITYPNAIDNDYKTWGAYQNRYWPHLFLADRQGLLRYDHIGEGAYDVTEQKIRELLG